MELVPISGHMCQHKDGVYKPSTAQIICESYESIKLLKTHMHKALHQRTITTEIITGEMKYSLRH
jgi:hypothetical protein